MSRPVLEYRLYQTRSDWEPLYHYTQIDLDQVLVRRECEFFVKNGVTYKQRSSAIEDDYYLLYMDRVEESEKEQVVFDASGKLTLEIRRLDSWKNHPVLQTLKLDRHLDVLARIGTIYSYIDGEEWERDSAETDEDRGVYVLYVTPTGYRMEDRR